MASLFENLLGKKTKSANRAKERLHLVLIHDRTDLSPEDLQSMKDRLIQVISDYVIIDSDETEIQIKTDGREQTLIANIPLRSPRSSR
ncbi:MAG: cell division topological specificity factor MinE [Chloroflexota bacterium]|jgi:cell division topological specificity factor|nr:cell division topological specificity factor MinE [Chloroflexota bacterium]